MPGEKWFIVEFNRVGAYVKVSAIDPATLREVSIVGDPAAGEEMLTRTAVRKLERMLRSPTKIRPPPKMRPRGPRI